MTDSNPLARFRRDRQEAGEEFREKLKKGGEEIKQTKTSKVIRGAISGPIKAINETIEFVDDIKDYVKGNPYDNNDFFPLQNTFLETEDDQDDPFYKIPQAVTQFLLPMGLISKGLSKAGMANVWARNALSGFVADTVVQDPLEENLFNMLDNHPRLESPITEILKTDEDASVAENRLRQAGGGFLAGEVVTALGLGIKGLKKSPELVDRIVKRLDERKKIKVNDFTTDNLGDEILDLDSVEQFKQQLKNDRDTLPPRNIDGEEIDPEGFYGIETDEQFDDVFKVVERPPVKPYKTNLEAKRGLSRGANNLKNRLRLEVNTKGADPNEVEAIETFIDTIGERMFDKEALSITTKLTKGGEYNFANNLIRIRKQIVEGVEQGAGGSFNHVMIHELWHGLSRYLPKEDLARYTKEFKSAQNKYLKQFEKEKTAFVRNNTPESLSQKIGPSPISFKLPKITEANYLKKARDYFDKTKFKNENYRFTNIDEFFAENMADEFMDMYRGEARIAGSPLDFAPQGTFKRIVQETKLFVEDLFVSLRARLGGSQTRKIFNDFVKRKNVKKYRNIPLDLDNKSGVAGMAKKKPDFNNQDPKIQTTFNPKFTGTSEEVRTNLLNLAEELKKKDANNTWPYRRTFADMAAAANAKLPAEIIEEARFFNQTYGRGGERDLPALLISMNQLMNKNANDLADLAAQLDMATTVNNTEAIKELGDQLVREAEVLNSLVYINKPLKSVPAQTLAANKVAGGAGKTAATADDLVSKSPIAGVPGNIEDAAKGTAKAAEDMDQTLKEVVDLAKEGNKEATRKLKNITKKLQAAKGNPEALREMARGGYLRKALEVNNELFINAILSGPQTHAVNVVSTALNTLVRPFDQSVGSLMKGDMTGFMRGGKELFYIAQSSGDALKAMVKAFQVEDNIINPSSMIDDRAEAAKRFRIRMDGPGWIPSLVNFAGTAVRLPSRFLLSEDEFFKQINFRAYVKATAWENGVKAGRTGKGLKNYVEEQFEKTIEIVNKNSMANVEDENIIDLYEKAQQYAAEVTFTNDLPQGTFGGDFQTFINKHPSARIFFPFVRTPINIFKTLGRRTALTAPFMDEYRQALKSTDPSVAAKARGELATGSMLWVTAGAAALGISDDFSEIAITGGGPRDFDLLNQKRQTGWQPYSFRLLKKDETGEPIIGADGRPEYKYINYQRLDPWSSFLAMSADITQIAGQLDYQDRQDLAVVAVTALSRNITNKTYLQGIAELAALINGEPYVLESYLQKRLAATVPFSALGRTIKKENDPTIKDKRPKAGDDGMVFVRRFYNELAAVVPGFGNLKPKQNFITGALVEYSPGYGPDNVDLLNPIRTSNSVNNLVMTTLDDIQMKVSKPKDRLLATDKFTGIELNSNQYQNYVNTIAFTKIKGKRMVHALYETMQTKEVKAILATARGEDITAINQDISVAAQERARRDAQDIFRDIINAYKKQGRIDWLKKPENRDLVKEYDANVNAINQTKNTSILENYLQSISN